MHRGDEKWVKTDFGIEYIVPDGTKSWRFNLIIYPYLMPARLCLSGGLTAPFERIKLLTILILNKIKTDSSMFTIINMNVFSEETICIFSVSMFHKPNVSG